jgi:hypothetical protein
MQLSPFVLVSFFFVTLAAGAEPRDLSGLHGAPAEEPRDLAGLQAAAAEETHRDLVGRHASALSHTMARGLVEYYPVCSMDPIVTTCAGLFETIEQQPPLPGCTDTGSNPDTSFCYMCFGNSLPADFRLLLATNCVEEYGLSCHLGETTYGKENGADYEKRATTCCRKDGGCTFFVEFAQQNCNYDFTLLDGTTTYPTCVIFRAYECIPDLAQACQDNSSWSTPTPPSAPTPTSPTPPVPRVPAAPTSLLIPSGPSAPSPTSAAPLTYKVPVLAVVLAASQLLCVFTQWV